MRLTRISLSLSIDRNRFRIAECVLWELPNGNDSLLLLFKDLDHLSDDRFVRKDDIVSK